MKTEEGMKSTDVRSLQFTLCTCHVSAPFAALGIAPAWNKSPVELAVQQGVR